MLLFFNPLPAESKIISMNMPHEMEKPVSAVRNLLRFKEAPISENGINIIKLLNKPVFNSDDSLGGVGDSLVVGDNDYCHTAIVDFFE